MTSSRLEKRGGGAASEIETAGFASKGKGERRYILASALHDSRALQCALSTREEMHALETFRKRANHP